MKLSVIIPTHNRKDILEKSLKAYERQHLDRSEFELIVIDDGSGDDTQARVNSFIKESTMNLRLFVLSDEGLPAARNTGIKEAHGDIILLMNADTMPLDPNFLNRHIDSVDEDTACVGHIDWHPELKITPIMEFLAPNGPLLDYSSIKNPKDCEWKHFFATNTSIYKKWFELELFDEQQPLGNEDIELGYRLKKRGITIKYHADIKAYHHHAYADFEEYLRTKMKRKQSYRCLIKKHPELRRSPWKQFAYNTSRPILKIGYKLTGLRFFRNLWWRSRIAEYFE